MAVNYLVTKINNVSADSNGNIAIGEEYSTSEVLTGGKWIDDKPIYRKIIQGTIISAGYTGAKFEADISGLGIDTLTNARCITSAKLTGVSNTTPSTGFTFTVSLGDNLVKTAFDNGGLVGMFAYITLEYTKTL